MSTTLPLQPIDHLEKKAKRLSLRHNPLIDLVLLAFRPSAVPETSPTRAWIKHHPVWSGIGLAYGLTWTGAIGVLMNPAAATQRSVNPFSLLFGFLFVGGCLWAALIVANATTGRRDLIGRLLRWRVHIVWYLVALFFPAFYMLGGILLNAMLGGSVPPLPILMVPPSSWVTVVLINVGVYLIGNFEEFTWRGILLPRLQARYSALGAALILGVVQTFWHLPYWLIPNSIEQQLGLPGFLGWNIGLNIVIAWVFNNSKGSLLLAQLFHAANDAWGGLLAAPDDLRPVWLSIGVLFVVSVALVAIFGAKHLSRKPEAEMAPAIEAG